MKSLIFKCLRFPDGTVLGCRLRDAQVMRKYWIVAGDPGEPTFVGV